MNEPVLDDPSVDDVESERAEEQPASPTHDAAMRHLRDNVEEAMESSTPSKDLELLAALTQLADYLGKWAYTTKLSRSMTGHWRSRHMPMTRTGERESTVARRVP